MDDRQLLEAAARAVDLPVEWDGDGYVIASKFRGHLTNYEAWNPLTDDGDALRLAVQCGLEVSFVNEDGEDRACVGYPNGDRISYVFEDHLGDIFAATRRAIVRAAAAIGDPASRAKGV